MYNKHDNNVTTHNYEKLILSLKNKDLSDYWYLLEFIGFYFNHEFYYFDFKASWDDHKNIVEIHLSNGATFKDFLLYYSVEKYIYFIASS